MQGVPYPAAVIFHPEQKHDDARPDCAHQRMVEHLHREAPFQSGDLFCNGLLGKIVDMIPSTAHQNICTNQYKVRLTSLAHIHLYTVRV